MFDPVHDDKGVRSQVPGPDPTVKIEHLLLSGLDHYFNGRYEHAIDVWTRVLFLDRSHARARAYIGRARAASAERLRESEELVHTGVEAFERGDVRQARSLLTSAVEQGGGRDEALNVLDRLDRLEAASGQAVPLRRDTRVSASGPAVPVEAGERSVARHVRIMPLVLLAGVLAVTGYLAISWGQWGPLLWAVPRRPVASPMGRLESVPVPSSADMSVARARRLVEDDRLLEAIGALASVHPGGPMSTEADGLRTVIQRRLLAGAGVTALPSSEAIPVSATDR